MRSHGYEELTASEFTQAMAETSLVYFPVGSMEFHGPHLPLGLDSMSAYEFCRHAAERTGGVVLPVTYWNANGHEGWPGSMLVREGTFRAIVRDVFALLAEQGVKLIVATTGHYPSKQGVTIARLAREAMRQRPATRVLTLDPYTCNPLESEVGHAGRIETSLMLALRPDLVHMERLDAGEDAFKGIGKDAGEATAEAGLEYFNASLETYVGIVRTALDELK